MPIAKRFRGVVFQNGNARVHGPLKDDSATGDYLSPEDFGSIAYWVVDQSNGSVVLGETSVAVGDVVSESPDANGNNFNLLIPAEAFPDGNRTYEVTIRFTLADGTVGSAVIELDCERVRGAG